LFEFSLFLEINFANKFTLWKIMDALRATKITLYATLNDFKDHLN
jgi:hypothetical protein